MAASLILAGCTSHLSYIESDFTDPGGVMASEITDVAVRKSERGAAITVVPPRQSDHPVGDTIVASVEGAGFTAAQDAPQLRYLISRLYDGFLLRVEYLGEVTAAFFRVRKGELVGAGPLTIQRGV